MLSLPQDWDYTLEGLTRINREGIDAIRAAILELERAGYIRRECVRDEKGRLRGTEYMIRFHDLARFSYDQRFAIDIQKA